MKTDNLLSKELVRELLDYDPITGKLSWRTRPRHYFDSDEGWSWWNAAYANKTTGRVKTDPVSGKSYVRVKILNRSYSAHRIIWLHQYGEFPLGETDHINGDGTDNRIDNLRDVSRVDNQRNHRRQSNNISGVTGVIFDKKSKKWHAYIYNEGKCINLGRFEHFSDAVDIRKGAESICGYHYNHGTDRPL